MRLPTPLRLIALDGQMLRDEGFARTLKSAHPGWMFQWKEIVYALPEGWEGIGEDIKHWCLRQGLAYPHSDKCWGAMVGGYVKSGGLREKRPIVLRKPRDLPSHASETRVWVRTSRL